MPRRLALPQVLAALRRRVCRRGPQSLRRAIRARSWRPTRPEDQRGARLHGGGGWAGAPRARRGGGRAGGGGGGGGRGGGGAAGGGGGKGGGRKWLRLNTS